MSSHSCVIYVLSFFFTSLTVYCLLQAASNSKNLDVGANLFIGNLDPEIDEKLLYDTFSAFGVILETPKVRDLWSVVSVSWSVVSVSWSVVSVL